MNSVNRMTALHREMCDELDSHVAPIGTGHGQSLHPRAKHSQCICGHRNYVTCPDYVGPLTNPAAR